MKQIEKKRFIIFGYDEYYPSGGMGDFISSFDTLEELLDKMKLAEEEAFFSRYTRDYFNILDIKHFKTGSGNSPTKAFSRLSEKTDDKKECF